MGFFNDKNLISIQNAKFEDEQIIKNTRYTYGLNGSTTVESCDTHGWGMVSHPSCLAVAAVTGMYSSSRIGLAKIFEKGNRTGDNGCIIVEELNIGYPYINRPDSGRTIVGQWETIDGYPIPIYDTTVSIQSSEKVASKTKCFAWNGVIYYVIETQRQLNGFKISGHLVPSEGSNVTNGTVETESEKDLVVLEDPNSNHFFVIGCDKGQAVAIKANSGFDTSGTLTTDKTPTSGASTYFCLGDNTGYLNKSGEIVFAFTTGFAKDATKTMVATALTSDWRESYDSCREYWRNIFTGLREQWINVPAKLRVRGYLALGQLICHMYNGTGALGTFLGAGSGVWYGNFIRDTAFNIKALSNFKPNIAGELLDFYANADAMYECNSFTIDGNGDNSGESYGADAYPTFLLAVGEYFRETGDITRITALSTQIDEAMKYIDVDYGNNYIEADGHILALHPHDFGDDSDTPFVMAETKYESMIDILWIAGLEAIAPVYTALGDTTKATYCTTIATALRSHLSDFAVVSGEREGMLAHAIKTDDSLDDSQSAWAATFMYGAWLLNKQDCWEWCKKMATYMGTKGSNLDYCVTLQNPYTSESPVYGWGPFYPLGAMLQYRFDGSMQAIDEICNYFPVGAYPEWITQEYETKGIPSSYTHAKNFPWTYSAIFEMINELA